MSEDLLSDLTMYKSYKDKSVMMAARSLILLYREKLPELLRKKDRGRPTEASIEIKPKKYGEVIAQEHIPGAEVLLNEKEKGAESDSESEDVDEDDDDGWVNVSHSEEDVDDSEVESNDDEDEEDDDDDEDDEN